MSARPEGPRSRVAVRLLALALGAIAVAAAARVALDRPVVSPGQVLVQRLATALLALQGPDGAFEPPGIKPGQPEVLRTVPHALAAAALARAGELGADAAVPGLAAGRRQALAVLTERQRPGGSFGALPPAARNPWPGVEATAGAVLAFALAGRPEDRPVLQAALVSLERTTAYDLRDGWTRALVGMALEAAAARGGTDVLGKDPRFLVRPSDADLGGACSDADLAEAIVRVVRGRGGAAEAAVAAACGAEEPAWLGERSDLSGWWMQAWLAARTDAPTWTEALRRALVAALEDPPEGRIAEGWYADEITQTATALLAAAEGLATSERRGHPR